MKIPNRVLRKLKKYAVLTIQHRKPDRIIGSLQKPYMHRWYVIPRNPFFNIYLHRFMRSDDDRALHDHPWFNCSILIHGRYYEWTKLTQEYIDGVSYKEQRSRMRRDEGHIYFRSPWCAHRVELIQKVIGEDAGASKPITITKGVITLFITGPVMRRWGFHCPKGWRDHTEFTKMIGNVSTIGRGCD